MTINNFVPCFFLILLLISCQNDAKKQMNDWKQFDLKGKVKQSKETVYNSYQDLLQKRKGYETIANFNKKGMLYSHATYLQSGQVNWLKYNYKQDSVIVEEFREVAGGKEIWQGRWIHTLDERGAQKRIVKILVSKEIGHIMEISNNDAGYNTVIEYKEKIFPERLPCKEERIFDENNLLVEERVFYYDEDSKLCLEKPIIVKRKNNEEGDLERAKVIGLDGAITKERAYLYKYDSLGNWLTKEEYEKDKIERVTLRKLEYYE